MSDERWLDIRETADSACGHFRRAVELYRVGGFAGDTLDAYRARMGFMHAVQSAHTSLEGAILRILDVLGEARPTGEQWHGDLIRRVCRPIEGPSARPAILSPQLCAAIDETRRFRNFAMHGYDSFEADKARRTVAAAEVILERFPAEVSTFMDVIDGP